MRDFFVHTRVHTAALGQTPRLSPPNYVLYTYFRPPYTLITSARRLFMFTISVTSRIHAQPCWHGLSPPWEKAHFVVLSWFRFWPRLMARNWANSCKFLLNKNFEALFQDSRGPTATPHFTAGALLAHQLRRRLPAPQAKQKWRIHTNSTFSFKFYACHMLTNMHK